MMDGEVSVESTYGVGSTFTVRLPQQVADAARIGDINIFDHARKKSVYRNLFTAPDAHILIVDDTKMNLTVEKKLLKDTKVQIDTATSGMQALELTLQKRYDVILMDHLMPEMDGIECLKRIRTQVDGKCRSVPVVILTANAISENQELYDSAGFDGYLVKPVTGTGLEETLMKHIPEGKMNVSEG